MKITLHKKADVMAIIDAMQMALNEEALQLQGIVGTRISKKAQRESLAKMKHWRRVLNELTNQLIAECDRDNRIKYKIYADVE